MKFASLVLLLLPFVAYAQAPAVPANVGTVQTVGYWQHAGQSGTYRLITTTEGWEHVRSRVFVEWVPEPASRDADRVPSQFVELQVPVNAVIEATARRISTSRIDIKLVARSNQVVRAKGQEFHFLATAPGIVKPTRRPAQ